MIKKICKLMLIVLPALCLALSLIPGIAMYEIKDRLVPYSVLTGFPEDSVLVMVSMLIPVLCLYLIATGVMYYRNDGRGMIKSTSIISGVALFFVGIPLLMDKNLQPFPYVILPALLAVSGAIAVVLTVRGEDRY